MSNRKIVWAAVVVTAMLLSPMMLTGPSDAGSGSVAGPLQFPMLMRTSPRDGETNVPVYAPIIANFSEPIEPSMFSIEINPVVPGLVVTFPPGAMSVTVQHATPFMECTWYTVAIRYRGDLMSGEVPNPWSFETVCIGPFILSTIPADGEVNVPLDTPIVITFSEPMDVPSFVVSISPSLGNITISWSVADTIVVIHHTPFILCTVYTVLVSHAHDKDGNDLVPGPVPNPWSFSTGCNLSLRCLEVHRMPPSDVLLTWRADPKASYFLVFHSNDRFAPWPWTVLANVTMNQVLMVGHLSDMENHFYIVRAYGRGGESANSTMGVLWHMQVTLNQGKSNTFWFSLPYNTIYRKASDVTGELTGAKIDVVGKWDPLKQEQILYYNIKGKWHGKDFSINPGEGLFLGVVSSFDWAVNGTDKTVLLSFAFGLHQKTHYYWLGLPYTGAAGTASELVLAIEGGLGPANHVRIDQVGKWDFARQSSDVFEWTPAGWRGSDFRIEPGDGIWMRVTSAFTWTPKLITPEVL